MDLVARDNNIENGELFDDALSVDSDGQLRVLRVASDVTALAKETGSKAQKRLRFVALTTGSAATLKSKQPVLAETISQQCDKENDAQLDLHKLKKVSK